MPKLTSVEPEEFIAKAIKGQLSERKSEEDLKERITQLKA